MDFKKIISDRVTANLLIISKNGGHWSLVTFRMIKKTAIRLGPIAHLRQEIMNNGACLTHFTLYIFIIHYFFPSLISSYLISPLTR